uniref:Nif11 domain-containing protein n=1 Tax=uncultured bacterium contig00093 TaxID=1181564 RepID=A0A806K0M9_9BACT|nr:hypothetical protein [uncultured bacterium contig00093]
METITEFYAALMEDEDMRERALNLNNKYQNGQHIDEATAAADIAGFAKSEGYEFSAEDLISYKHATSRELTDGELDAVAGGAYSERSMCFIFGNTQDPETGYRCICLLNGAGTEDNNGGFLYCMGIGGMARMLQ